MISQGMMALMQAGPAGYWLVGLLPCSETPGTSPSGTGPHPEPESDMSRPPLLCTLGLEHDGIRISKTLIFQLNFDPNSVEFNIGRPPIVQS